MRNRSLALSLAALVGCGLIAAQLSADVHSTASSEQDSLLKELTQAAQADPADAPTRLRLGLLLADMGRIDEARAWFDEAASIDQFLHDSVVWPIMDKLSGESTAPGLSQRGGFSLGADIELTDSRTVSSFGPVGGIRGYAIGSDTCNVGDANLSWVGSGTPGLAMNAYRLWNGRLIQLGQSWVKTACCAFQSNGCGLGCTPGAGLGAGCQDVYTSGWNSGQGRLARRSTINAFTGVFSGPVGVGGSTIAGEIQVPVTDFGSAAYPGALYFMEGVYVSTEDAIAGNRNNNASYKQVNIADTGVMSIPGTAVIRRGIPAINAWRDHGLGLNSPDNSVTIQDLDVPSEGRFVVADKAIDNGDGTWRYEYAIFNLSSDRSGGSFTVTTPAGALITNVGFRDVMNHSGEIYDNTDWVSTVSADNVSWTSPQTFAQNANSNALRWGTMYNFWFTANRPPTDVDATLGLFKPHTPTGMRFAVRGPVGGPCPADLDGDGSVGAGDLAILSGAWGTPLADLNADNNTNSADLAMLLGDWGPCF